MVLGRRFVLRQHFVGNPKPEDFDLVEEELKQLQDGDIQFRALFLSLDAHMRTLPMIMKPPFTMFGRGVGVVEQSKNPKFPIGCTIVHTAGWVERGVVNPEQMSKSHGSGNYSTEVGKSTPYKHAGVKKADDIEIGNLSKSHLLGVFGMSGNTAYFGLTEVCQANKGETVVVSGAAGSVGNLVGQIAKTIGCRVIGFAGTEEKCSWLKSFGFDEAFNYKKCGVAESLAAAAPNGVDCYFDNVGGELSAAVMAAMNTCGRIAVCGTISKYNEVGGYSKVTDILPLCVAKELRIEGFLVSRWTDRYTEGVTAMVAMVMRGEVQVKETVVEGFENMPKALLGLFTGDNTGKMIVKA